MKKEWIDLLKVIRGQGGSMIVYESDVVDALHEIKKYDNTLVEMIDNIEIVRDTVGIDFNEEKFLCNVLLLPNGNEALRRDNLSGKVTKNDIFWLKKSLVGLRVAEDIYIKVLEMILEESLFEVSHHEYEYERIYLKGYGEEDSLEDFFICSVEKEVMELEYEGEEIDLIEIQNLKFKK